MKQRLNLKFQTKDLMKDDINLNSVVGQQKRLLIDKHQRNFKNAVNNINNAKQEVKNLNYKVFSHENQSIQMESLNALQFDDAQSIHNASVITPRIFSQDTSRNRSNYSLQKQSMQQSIYRPSLNEMLQDNPQYEDETFKILRQDFIDQSVNEYSKSIYGLPSIGGPITQRHKTSKFNFNLANNGSQAVMQQYTNRNQRGPLATQQSDDAKINNMVNPIREFKKNAPNANIEENLKLPNLSQRVSNQKVSQSISLSSNANFSNVFKLTKSNFKTPRQLKMGVVYSSSKVEKHHCHGLNKATTHEPAVSFKPAEPAYVISETDSSKDLDDSHLNLNEMLEPEQQTRNSYLATQKSSTETGSFMQKGIQESLLESINFKTQNLIKMQREQNKDKVTGLNIDNYLIEKDFDKIMKFLQKLIKERQENSIITQQINIVAQECEVDPEQFYRDVQKFFDKRTLVDAVKNDKSYNCSVTSRSMKFLKGESTKDFPAACNHDISEEDAQMQYINEYRRYFKFIDMLRQKLRSKIKKQELVQSLKKQIKNIDNLTHQEKKLFEDEEAINELLQDPMLEIVMTMKEIEQYKKRDRGETIENHQNIVNSKDKVLIRKSSKILIDAVSKQVIKDSLSLNGFKAKMQSESLRYSYNGKNRRQTFLDLPKLINETKNKQESNFELLNDEQKQKLEKQNLINQVELMRIGVIKQFQEEQIRHSFQVTQEQRPKINFEELNEDDFNDLRQKLRNLDEDISERARNFIEKQNEIFKTKYNREMLIMQVNHQQQDEESEEEFTTQNTEEDIRLKGNNIFNDLEAKQKFYSQAKREIQGYNKKPNQDSAFYHECNRKYLIAQPVFKCVNCNMIKYQGKSMGEGYSQAVANYVQSSTKIENLITKIHLDDCAMKDLHFSTILEGVKNSKLGVSLQNLTYSNNEMGLKSINLICDFINIGQLSSIKCLKELQLSNVQVKSFKDMRILTSCLAENGSSLTKLRFSQMNLCDNDIIQHLCEFLDDNKELQYLELSGCHLQAKHLLMVATQIESNQTLNVLDLSGNGVSELVDDNQIKQAQFLQSICRFLKNNESLYSLNLQGLLLGKKLLFFVDQIKNNRSLVQLNLVNNLLNKNDEAFILELLGIIRQNDQNLMEKYDMCYQNSMNRFKVQHLTEELKTKMNDENQVTQNIINSGIVKQIRSNRALQGKLNLNQQIGEVIASTGSKSLNFIDGTTNVQDKVFLRRFVGFTEFVFKEMGKDIFDQYDFNKPFQWQAVKPNPRGQTFTDINDLQYVMVFVNMKDPEEDFTPVDNDETIQILKNYLNFQAIDTKHEYPLIFGTFSDWKVFQMQRAYQYASILCAQTDEDKKALTETVFDDKNYKLKEHFKNIYGIIYSTINSTINMQNAQVVGQIPDTLKKQESQHQYSFMYAQFVPPGKHSVYIYDPEVDEFFKKIIAVDVPSQSFTQKNLSTNFELTDDHRISTQLFPKQRYLEGFLDDTSMCKFDLNSLLTDNVPQIMQSIYEHYKDLVTIFQELQSECQDSYPLVSFGSLREFCEKTGVIDPQKLDETIEKTNKKEDDKKKQLVDSQFENIDRSGFLKFLIWACQEQSEKFNDEVFQWFLNHKVIPLVESSTYEKVKLELKDDKEIQQYVRDNMNLINLFYDKYYSMFDLTPREAVTLFQSIPISEYNLRKFYALSKDLVVNEHDHQSYLQLSRVEFIELVYRVAEHIYNPSSYKEAPATISAMFDQTMAAKFKNVLQQLMWEYTLKDSETEDQIKSMADQVGGMEHYEMLKYLPPSCHDDYVDRIKYNY